MFKISFSTREILLLTVVEMEAMTERRIVDEKFLKKYIRNLRSVINQQVGDSSFGHNVIEVTLPLDENRIEWGELFQFDEKSGYTSNPDAAWQIQKEFEYAKIKIAESLHKYAFMRTMQPRKHRKVR